MKQDKYYRVLKHKFIGYSETGSATYEITFNKSLEHTGRFSGIEDGLNAYCKIESRTDIADNFKRSLRDCKEEWASKYDKTWEEVQKDFEYGNGLAKMLDFEQVMDMVAELYKKQ